MDLADRVIPSLFNHAVKLLVLPSQSGHALPLLDQIMPFIHLRVDFMSGNSLASPNRFIPFLLLFLMLSQLNCLQSFSLHSMICTELNRWSTPIYNPL